MAIAIVASAFGATSAPSIMDGWPMLLLAAGVWLLEAQRRGQGAPRAGLCMPRCRHLIPEFAPEAAALLSCAVLAALLLQHGGYQASADAADQQIMMQLSKEWPLLRTADSLLALQAMLRLLLLASAALRRATTHGFDAAPLAGAPATLMLCACITRLVILMVCPDLGLDGPLGGLPNTAFEMASLPLLMFLSHGNTFRMKSMLSIVVLAAVCLGVANHFALAEDAWFNGFFSSVYIIESAASIAFLISTVATCGASKNPMLDLLHVWLPLQQSLSFYYFLVAFEETPELIGAGQPFHLMNACGIVQVSAYIAAAALHFVMEQDEAVV